jgi:hypothetical protein
VVERQAACQDGRSCRLFVPMFPRSQARGKGLPVSAVCSSGQTERKLAFSEACADIAAGSNARVAIC